MEEPNRLEKFLKQNSHVNVVTVENDIMCITRELIGAEKYRTVETAIAKINGRVRSDVITEELDDREKRIWGICLGVVIAALFEELETLTTEE